MPKKMTTKEFINKSTIKHNNIYDYSKVIYINSYTKVDIICSIHGIFSQSPNAHLNKKNNGCAKCGGVYKYNTEEFINLAKSIHGSRYDYSNVIYKGNKTKIILICNKHGHFSIRPNDHLSINKVGCAKCGTESASIKISLNKKEFIKRSEIYHKNIYDYSNVIYKNRKTKVKIICNKHGEFKQVAELHMLGHGCPQCAIEINTSLKKNSFKEILYKFKEIHGDKYKYIYNKELHINNKSKIKIICPTHGIFSQRINTHSNGHGCPKCKRSIGEEVISDYLIENNIIHIDEYKFKDCIYKNPLQFDFYLPEYNLCIEYDGKQHFESVEFFGGDKKFEELKKRDKIKNEYCKENNIHLLRIPYYEFININNIINIKIKRLDS